MVPHYLVKIETPKMVVNTSSVVVFGSVHPLLGTLGTLVGSVQPGPESPGGATSGLAV